MLQRNLLTYSHSMLVGMDVSIIPYGWNPMHSPQTQSFPYHEIPTPQARTPPGPPNQTCMNMVEPNPYYHNQLEGNKNNHPNNNNQSN